jgi:urease accessory protein
MSVNVSPFEAAALEADRSTLRQKGIARLYVERSAGQTAAIDIDETGPLRLRFPRIMASDALEAVLVNTGGGVVGGDSMKIEVETGEGAKVSFTSQAAEKIYRSTGPAASIEVRLKAGAKSALHWVPQETILFDRARAARTIEADMAADATLTICEAVIFGRSAMGESVVSGTLRDKWHVRRDGKLIFADALTLDGNISETLKRPAIGKGATAVATMLQIAPDVESKLDMVRASFEGQGIEAGASAFDGILIARIVARDGLPMRSAVLGALSACGAVIPRAYTL